MPKTTFKFNGDTKKFQKAVDKIQGDFKKISKGAEKSASKGTSAFKVFLGTFSAMALKSAFSAALKGFRSLNRFVVESINLSAEQEKAVNDLNAQLKLNGEFTKETSQELQKYASELQSITTFGDEAILGQLAFAQAMGASAKQSKTVVSASADLAASLNIDLNSAVRNVAKTLGGYAGELGEVIPELKNLSIEQLRAGEGVDLLAQKFEGAASQQVKTFAGQTEQLSNSFGDLQEKIGDVFTGNDEIIGSLGILKDSFNELGQFIVDNKDELQSLATDGFQIVVQSSSFLIQSIASISSAFLSARESYLKFANADEIRMLEDDLANLPKSIDNFGNEVEGTYAKILRKRIETLKGERDAENESYQNRLTLIEEFQEKIQGFEQRILESKKERNNQEVEAEKEKNEMLNEVRAEQREKEAELREEEKERELEKQEQDLQKSFEKLAFVRQVLGKEEALKAESRARELAADDKLKAAQKELDAAGEKARKKSIDREIKLEQEKAKVVGGIHSGLVGFIEAVTKEGNKAVFLAQKALAASQVIIQGIAAESAALAPPPIGAGPIAGAGLAGLIRAKTAIGVATIAAQTITGAKDGAVVEGGSITRDTEPFMLSRGEIVAPRKSFDEVVEGTARQRGFVKGGGNESKNINLNIDTFIGQDEFINDVIDQIREKILFENADLGVS